MKIDKQKIELLSDGLLSIREAAEYVQVDRHVIEEMLKTGEIAHLKLGPRQTRIPKRALLEFLASRMRGAA